MSKPRNALRFTLVAAMMIAPTLAGQATAHAEPGDSPEARAAALIKPAVVYLEARLNGRVIDEHGTELNGGEPFKILVRRRICRQGGRIHRNCRALRRSGVPEKRDHSFRRGEHRRTRWELGRRVGRARERKLDGRWRRERFSARPGSAGVRCRTAR